MSQHPYTAFADQVLRRVDAVLRGEDCPWPISDGQRYLLIVLRAHVGRDNAITRPQLVELLQEHDREIRSMVSDLRTTFSVAIGSSRAAGASGYFLIATAAEAEQLTKPLIRQGASIFRLVRIMRGRHFTAELFGQLRMELQLDQEHDHA